jgi:stage II sporulation protein P
MNRKKLRKIILSALLTCGLLFSGMIGTHIKTYANPDTMISVTEQQNVYKGRVLLYSSHTCEKNKDSTVADVSVDLANKLKNKGYKVDLITDDFVKNGYGKAYYQSRAMLQSKDLSSYQLTVDLHFDSADVPISTRVNGNEVARLMFPTVSENPYIQQQKALINGIKDKLNEFSSTIVRVETTAYRRGITYYNSDMTPNFILVEVGGDKNDIYSCKRAITYLASAIDSYLNQK